MPKAAAEVRRLDGDLGQFLGGRVGVDRAVAVDQHLVGISMKNTLETMLDAGRGVDQLQGRADGVGGGVHGAGHQPVHVVLRQHHGAEHDVVLEAGLGLRRGQTLVLRSSTIGATYCGGAARDR